MKLVISKEIANSYPDSRIAILVATNLSITEKDGELEKLKRKCEAEVRAKYASSTLVQHPFIAAWRDAYRGFGEKPKEHNPSAEALIRRILQDDSIPCINTLVDSYLLVEAETFLPIGGYDLEKIVGNIYLHHSAGNEEFTPIGAPKKEITNAGEVIYSDDARALTRRWNYKDCDYAKITLQTKRAVLFIEAADKRMPTDSLAAAAEKLKDILTRFCGGTISITYAFPQEKLELGLI